MRLTSKAETVSARSTTPEQDEGHQEQPNHHDDFQSSKPELGLAIEFYRKQIQSNNDNNHDRDPDRYVYVGVPVIYHKPSSSDLVRYQDSETVEVQPS